MDVTIIERLEALRDEALNVEDFGEDATGEEIFEAIVSHVTHFGHTDPGLDLRLRDALSRRLAWGDTPHQVAVDCEGICTRLFSAVPRITDDCVARNQVSRIILEVGGTAARHVAMIAAKRSSRERARQRQEQMVQRQLASALSTQNERIASLTSKLNND